MHNTDTHAGPSFSLQNRLARLVWNVAAFCLFKLSPKPFHGWRRFVLRCFGAKVGAGVHVYPGVGIWAPWNLELDDQCGIASGAVLYSQDKIHIGKKTVISQGTYLCTGTHDYNKIGFPLTTSPIHIGDEVWVAAQAFVHPGVTIGDGAVIGARSVVVRDIPAWTLCSGNPCKPIRERSRPI